jgi:hypothetical protein
MQKSRSLGDAGSGYVAGIGDTGHCLLSGSGKAFGTDKTRCLKAIVGNMQRLNIILSILSRETSGYQYTAQPRILRHLNIAGGGSHNHIL